MTGKSSSGDELFELRPGRFSEGARREREKERERKVRMFKPKSPWAQTKT